MVRPCSPHLEHEQRRRRLVFFRKPGDYEGGEARRSRERTELGLLDSRPARAPRPFFESSALRRAGAASHDATQWPGGEAVVGLRAVATLL